MDGIKCTIGWYRHCKASLEITDETLCAYWHLIQGEDAKEVKALLGSLYGTVKKLDNALANASRNVSETLDREMPGVNEVEKTRGGDSTL